MSVQKKFGQVERTPFDDAAIETLIASGLFAGVARSEIGGFLAQFGARCRSFQNGEVVADEGAMLSEMGVVLSGHLHVYDSAFTGERHLIRIVRPGGVVGASLISSGLPTYPAMVTAHGNCRVAVFELAPLRKLLKTGGGGAF